MESSVELDKFFVNIRKSFLRFNEIIKYVNFNEYDGHIWGEDKRSRIIDSILSNIPIPSVYMDGSNKGWIILNGYNRLYSILSFMNDEYPLQGMNFMKELNGLRYSEIPFRLRYNIEFVLIEANILNPGIREHEKKVIYDYIK
jgi:hypothetical protein